MRIALNATSDVGHRAGRILLAEPGLDALGLYGHTASTTTEDRRMTAIHDLSGFDLLVSDMNSLGIAAIAAEDGISCVLSTDREPDADLAARFRSQHLTLLVGAALGPGIATTLALRELAHGEDPSHVTIAWTEPGRPLRHGEAVPFPDPVGPLWGRRLPRHAGDRAPIERITVPTSGPWSATVAWIKSRTGSADRVVGVADADTHLRAIALAAGAIAVAEGHYEPGAHRPRDNTDAYLAAALRIGLEVAAFDLGD
jgi:hypothetical protein